MSEFSSSQRFGVSEFEPLFNALLSKTKDGQLSWVEIAASGDLVTSVRGEKLFQIEQLASPEVGGVLHCTVRNKEGDVELTFNRTLDEESIDLYKTASDSAGKDLSGFFVGKSVVSSKIDERVKNSVDLLESL